MAKKTKESDKSKAKEQKDILNDLYYDKNRNKVLETWTPEQPCYIIENGFLAAWRHFIRYVKSKII